MNINHITLAGKQYPICLSMYATERINEEFGSMEEMGNAVGASSGTQVKSLHKLLLIMLEAGKRYCNAIGVEVPPMPFDPADVIDLTDPSVVRDLFTGIRSDKAQDVEIKNAVPTQEG